MLAGEATQENEVRLFLILAAAATEGGCRR